MIVLSEFAGRTIKDMISLMRKEIYKVSFGDLFGNMRMFKKICFEALYAIYCMNKFEGIVHTDLHVNNATMFIATQTNYTAKYPELYVGNGYIKFYLNNRKDKFLLPYYNGYFAIIDFSRGFKHKHKLNKDDVVNEKSKRI